MLHNCVTCYVISIICATGVSSCRCCFMQMPPHYLTRFSQFKHYGGITQRRILAGKLLAFLIGHYRARCAFGHQLHVFNADLKPGFCPAMCTEKCAEPGVVQPVPTEPD